MIRRCLALSVALLLAGCGGGGGDSGGGRTIASVVVTSGDQQSATVATELPNALVATVLDASGQPIGGQTLSFVVTSGGGSVFVASTTSDDTGVVRERWTMGTASGAQAVQVRAVDASGAGVVYATFTATALPGPVTTLAAASGDAQTANQAQALPTPVVLSAKDSYGNPVPNVAVAFAASGDGVVLPASAATDASGQASASWTLGKAIGTQRLSATVAGVAPFTFSATALQAPPGTPMTIALVSGDQQTVLQHAKVAAPFTVLVTDALGNPVPGATVAFAAATGSGYVTPQSVATGSDGTASWQGYFHTAGTETLAASIAGGPSASFTTTVQANSHDYDGYYACTLTDGQSNAYFLVTGGLIPGDRSLGGLGYGTLDESDGTVAVYWRLGLGDYLYMTGTASIAANTVATGSGTFIEQKPVPPDVPPPTLASGNWACTRQ